MKFLLTICAVYFTSLVLIGCGSDQRMYTENSRLTKVVKEQQIILIDSTQEVFHVYDLTEAFVADKVQLTQQLKGKEIYISGTISEVNENDDAIFFYDTKLKKGILVYFKDPDLRKRVKAFDKVILKGKVENINDSYMLLIEGVQVMYR